MIEKMITIKDAATLPESLGIHESRTNELIDFMMNTNEKNDKFSTCIGEIWNTNAFTFEEKIFMTFQFRKISQDYARIIHEKLVSLILKNIIEEN